MKERGLHGVVRVVSDDHSGLKKAIREVLPEAIRQRCCVHYLRNARAHLSRRSDEACLQELRWIYDRPTVEEARSDLAAWLKTWQGSQPKLCDWVEETIEESSAFLRLPRRHHLRMRSTNMLERLNGETRRRTAVVRIFPDARSCLRLVRALCAEIHERWMEDGRYLNMDLLQEQRRADLRSWRHDIGPVRSEDPCPLRVLRGAASMESPWTIRIRASVGIGGPGMDWDRISAYRMCPLHFLTFHKIFMNDIREAMFVDVVPNRKSPPTVLIRHSYREGGKVKKRTLANITKLPPETVEKIRAVLSGAVLADAPGGELDGAFGVARSLQHGNVAAVLAALRACGVEQAIHTRRSRSRDLAVALVAQRILEPGSKLVTDQSFRPETATSTLASQLGLPEDVSEDRLCEAMDWLLERQPMIEKALAEKHMSEGSLILYDLTSVWTHSRTYPPAKRESSRDGKREPPQIEFGLLCDGEGRPFAVEAFHGNTADPSAVTAQVGKLRDRFRLKRAVFVGDRGMAAQARIREDLEPNGFDWIFVSRDPTIRSLADSGELQPSLFDEQDMAEIECQEQFPSERLVFCGNPLLAKERTRKRQELDGFYVIRTNVPEERMSADKAVLTYENLGRVERAFRTMKASDLEVRPVHRRLERRVRAHLLICMLACRVEMHMRKALAPMLFDDEDGRGRDFPVAKAAAKRRRSRKAVHDFPGLLKHLGNLTMNQIEPSGPGKRGFDLPSSPTPVQEMALRLLNAKISKR